MKHYRLWMTLAVSAWTLATGFFLAFQLKEAARDVEEYSRIQARSSLNKDLSYRKWNSGHGGVYVPVTPSLAPNPYLTVPNRDIRTTGGQDLTLVNPAYMTRMVHEQSGELYGERGHITSLKPLRPENGPDAWEAAALERFEAGETEVAEVVSGGGQDYYRMMIPLTAEASCLKCHAVQGYKEGDVRGGLSVAVSLAPYMENFRSASFQDSLVHSLIWILGTLGILGTGGVIRRTFLVQAAAQAEVRSSLEQKKKLIQELQHRATNNMNIILGLMEMQAVSQGSEALKKAFSEVESRIRALSLVHRQLVGSQDLSHVNLGRYAGELVRQILEKRDPKAAPVVLSERLEEVEVLIDSALPCALIINEAVNNALSHGLPGGGCLTLGVSKTSGGEIVLEVGDDGPGLPGHITPNDPVTLGLSLISLMGEQQLRGRLEFSHPPGLTMRLTFRDNIYTTRV